MIFRKITFFKFFGILFFVCSLSGNFAWGKETPETQISDPSAYSWQIIDEAIKDRNPDKRREIVVAASLGGPYKKVFDFLSAALEDKKVEVRIAACGSLASLKSPETIEALKKAIQDPVPEVFFCAAQALLTLDDPMGEKIVLEVLEGERGTSSSYLSSHQREAMNAFNSKGRFFSTLFRLGIRFAPVPGLAMGFNSLEELTRDHKAGGKVISALALAHATDEASLQALVQALQDKNELVRAAAIHSLALRNDPSVREKLVPLLNDESDKVSYRAAVAYLRLTHVEDLNRSGSFSPVAAIQELQ